ncbi:hypothetical protein ZIOFF_005876 [Zingiber officinale]|uniref:MBD domain-containing protein n=1 Tax=Zingiber officinale TaxID=94328 RepID=A0A8J5HN09_ZINOF|nr:hypothetical protein ZIOFF_005876 [Zingiber officinale]
MAEQEEIKGVQVTPEKAAGETEPDAVELTAPAGWTKKVLGCFCGVCILGFVGFMVACLFVFVLNEDGTPRRNEILFISPTGEEIKSRRQLQQYLKAHPGSPSSAEFDWRTGDTPRRSARIREKAKAVEVPEDEKPKKRERKASSKKETKEKATEGDEASPVKEDITTEVKEDVSMQEVADVETKVDDDANKAIEEGVAVGESLNEKKETKEKATEGDEASPVKEDITTEVKEDVSMQEVADVATKVDDDANKAIEEGVAVGESLNEKKDPVLESNGSDENKTEASSENKEEATPRAEPIVSLPADDKNSKHNSEEAFTGKEKHDGDISTDNSKHEDAVLKELPSASCGDAQHLPKASPVNC